MSSLIKKPYAPKLKRSSRSNKLYKMSASNPLNHMKFHFGIYEPIPPTIGNTIPTVSGAGQYGLVKND